MEELAGKMGKEFPQKFLNPKQIFVGAYVQIDQENKEDAKHAQAFNNYLGNVQDALNDIIAQIDHSLPATTIGMPRIGLLISCQDEEGQWHHMYGYDEAYNSDQGCPRYIEQAAAEFSPHTPQNLKSLFDKHQAPWKSEDPSKDPSIPSEGDIFVGVRAEYKGKNYYFSQFATKENLSFWLTKVNCVIEKRLRNFDTSSSSKVFYSFARRDGEQWQPIYTDKEYGIEGIKWAPDKENDQEIVKEMDSCFQRLKFLSPFRAADWQHQIPLKCTGASVVIAVTIGQTSYKVEGPISAYYQGKEMVQEKIDQKKREWRRKDIDWLLMQALLRVQSKGIKGEIVGAQCILTYETEFGSKKWTNVCATIDDKGQICLLEKVPDELQAALFIAQATRKVTRLTVGLK